MLKFRQFLEEGGQTKAANMETYIVIAFNGGYDKAKDLYKVKPNEYEKVKGIAENIAKDIRKTTKAKPNTMIHFGKGTGKMISWWKGKNTPKTDMYTTGGVTISLKQAGPSQLASGFVDETLSTFKAAQIYMDENAPKEVDKLVKNLESVMGELKVQGNITAMTDAIRDNIIPDKIVAPSKGNKRKKIKKYVTVIIDKKKYEEEMTTLVNWKEQLKAASEVTAQFFQDNPEFKKWFTYEAATGDMKFQPDKYANSQWMVVFDPKQGINNTIEMLSRGSKPTKYIETLSKKVKMRIGVKTPTGSEVTLAGKGKTSGSMRVTLEGFLQNEFRNLTNQLMLTEEYLTEAGLFQKVKEWMTSAISKILKKIKELAEQGIQYVLDFIDFKPKSVSVSGLSIFGL